MIRKLAEQEPVIETTKYLIMTNIKFDIYESPANEGEKKKFHVRNTNKETVRSKDLMREAARYTSVSRSDWAAVVEGLIDVLSEKLGEGKRVHINGLGYFSVSIGSTENESPKKMTRRTVQVTGINFRPEKSFKKSIVNGAHFVRERYKMHTADLSPVEVDGVLTEYFKDHRSITCARMQQTCGMTRSTAYRRLKALTEGEHPSLLREGCKNATAYIPVKGHYGRSYTADRW